MIDNPSGSVEVQFSPISDSVNPQVAEGSFPFFL